MLLSLAPMDWITDAAFRKITEDIFKLHWEKENQLILTTEFMSADGFIANPWWVAKHLLKYKESSEDRFRRLAESKNKIINIAQIFWGNEENLIKTALWIKENLPWYDFVELNIWCPAPKICKIWAWSAMMKNKEKTLQIIKKLSQILDWKFSIKTRIGLTKEDISPQTEFIVKASKYCKIITIHWRTFDQQHSWEVNRQAIYQIKEKIKNNCKIIWNGWIKSYKEIQEKIWNLDGIAVWQGAIWNPRIFTPHQPNREEKKKTILKHLNLFLLQENRWENIKNLLNKTENKQQQLKILKKYLLICHLQTASDTLPTSSLLNHQKSSVIPFRKHLFSYLKWYPNAKQIKQEIIQTTSIEKLKKIINKI